MIKLPAVAMICLALALTACQKPEPFEYTELEEGPGLFSGKAGEFVIYRK